MGYHKISGDMVSTKRRIRGTRRRCRALLRGLGRRVSLAPRANHSRARVSVFGINHIGTTTVPGVRAKPVVDMPVVVVASADEDAYLPAWEISGYSAANDLGRKQRD
ncbi:MAG: hypothetical protein F4Y62_03525 [Rhodospirillaceae bacterium]|nr:hypothetical protein [Rhodospirillaceae bacterium]MYK14347.1 hypothetical protein [Rhodospirillaceae bacterium]